MTTQEADILVVEVPHCRPAKVYWINPDFLTDLIWDDESQWLMEHDYYDTEPTLDIALEALGHDLHSLQTFDSLGAAKTYYENNRQHQRLCILAQIRDLTP